MRRLASSVDTGFATLDRRRAGPDDLASMAGRLAAGGLGRRRPVTSGDPPFAADSVDDPDSEYWDEQHRIEDACIAWTARSWLRLKGAATLFAPVALAASSRATARIAQHLASAGTAAAAASAMAIAPAARLPVWTICQAVSVATLTAVGSGSFVYWQTSDPVRVPQITAQPAPPAARASAAADPVAAAPGVAAAPSAASIAPFAPMAPSPAMATTTAQDPLPRAASGPVQPTDIQAAEPALPPNPTPPASRSPVAAEQEQVPSPDHLASSSSAEPDAALNAGHHSAIIKTLPVQRVMAELRVSRGPRALPAHIALPPLRPTPAIMAHIFPPRHTPQQLVPARFDLPRWLTRPPPSRPAVTVMSAPPHFLQPPHEAPAVVPAPRQDPPDTRQADADKTQTGGTGADEPSLHVAPQPPARPHFADQIARPAYHRYWSNPYYNPYAPPHGYYGNPYYGQPYPSPSYSRPQPYYAQNGVVYQ